MSEEEAGAIIWTLASPEVHRALTQDCGWAGDHSENGCATCSPRPYCPDAASRLTRPRHAHQTVTVLIANSTLAVVLDDGKVRAFPPHH